ncbi:cysteine dioxygenase [Leptidea sinapis]|uniref:cysteine dioxygenase n=1 Tax=Leptidea sinapis TaxID=189913 RepID=UPI0021C30FC8|nr:cysteine dioxygenase [Leptidea sinapis]
MEIENANCRSRLSECVHSLASGNYSIERPLKVDIEIPSLKILIEELHRVFENNYVNIQHVQKLMAAYKSNPKDWKKFAKFDRYRYTRNLVDAGNGLFNIMILCWGAGHASAIHDHADAHCFMKQLDGTLEEVRYAWPETVEPEVLKKLKKHQTAYSGESGDVTDSENNNSVCDRCHNGSCQIDRCEHLDECTDDYDTQSMREIGRTRLELNDVCYINDALGLHRVENPSHVDGAVSLHLYCPPFDSCRVFDARTGKPTNVKVTFWSEYGKKMKRVMDANEVADSQQ